jgi:hypothetical protein
LATHSGIAVKVANFRPEQVANFPPESVANFDRNRRPTWSGIRNCEAGFFLELQPARIRLFESCPRNPKEGVPYFLLINPRVMQFALRYDF